MAKKDSSRGPAALAGAVRVDEDISRLSARLEPGEIAVIDAPDLDRSSALALLTQRPLAVLNVSSSTTGRRPSLGAQLLVEGGIVVVDDLGTDVMTLAEGQQVRLVGGSVYRGDDLVAAGQVRTAAELAREQSGGRSRLLPSVQSFAQTAGITWQQESDHFLSGEGVPSAPNLSGRTAIVVLPGVETRDQLRKLKKFTRDHTCSIIAVGEAANEVRVLGKKPDVLVGDQSKVPEKLLRSVPQLILLERPDGTIPGEERVQNLGVRYQTMVTSASPGDAATLLADVNGATQIVVVGDPQGVGEFLDQGGAELTSGFFINLRTRDRVVAGPVAARLYRPAISLWQLGLLLLAALVVLAAALAFTPLGEDALLHIQTWLQSIFGASSATDEAAAALWALPLEL